ncbi:hypothetical protein K3495_g3571 [Podosphaera aphanis]|nr:hypothetical protein K3495_g3571 [Podosphaera aphanis]
MVDQNNPGSLDMSINESSKPSLTPKDKACPFCQQQFTSSSLGRHLDLYIKEKNPKPADGIHDIDEIRRLRGGITRRQPRNSTSKREHSIISTGTSGIIDGRSPRTDGEREKNRSPGSRREEGSGGYPLPNQHDNKNKANEFINRASWESTGVINNIPTPWSGNGRTWDGEEKDHGRRHEARSRSVNRKILAKANYEQKQKLAEAVDNAKAAALALRELVGSLRAAKQQVQGAPILDYDPLTMDFPSLCLNCLPPPPTLLTHTPIPSQNSWALTPPEESQYQALSSHFTTAFHRYRVSLATNTAMQDQPYPNQGRCSFPVDSRTSAASLESTANKLECKVRNHLQAVFRAWQALPLANRTEIWTISLARSVNNKSIEIASLKKEIEGFKQEAAHLKQQVDELSRLQHPREFRISQPRTARIDAESVAVLGEWALGIGVDGKIESETSNNDLATMHGIGINVLDQNVPIDAAVECTIGRWKSVVKEARKQHTSIDETGLPERSLLGQQKLGRDSIGSGEKLQSPNVQVPNQWDRARDASKNVPGINAGVGSDADADADMEEEDGSLVEMVDAPSGLRMSQNHPIHLQPQHYQQQQARDQNFRLGHGNQSKSNSINVGSDPNHNLNNQNIAPNENLMNNTKLNSSNNNNRGMEGLENQVVGGYVRIGA